MKILSEYLLLPSGIMAVLSLLALAAVFTRRFRRVAADLVIAAMLLYVVFGSGWMSHWLMSHLEYQYPPSQEAAGSAVPDTMVVLTGYAQSSPGMPLSGQVNPSSGYRILEAASIFHRTRHMTVVISGDDEVPKIMRDLLVSLGVPAKSVVTDSVSYSTYESAVNLRERLRGKPFYLVTSAGHMPRAMGVFRKQGLTPIPAPTEYLSAYSVRDWNVQPNGRHLAISDLAVHEFLGLVWYRLQGYL